MSDLCRVLRETLLITEEVKKRLERECDEAAFVLKPWRVRAAVEERADENSCCCKQIADKNEAEEIAAGISRAIILAQELREKLKFNVATKGKTSRRDTVESIYLPSGSDRKKVSKTAAGAQKGNCSRGDCKTKSTALASNKATRVATRELSKSVDRAKRSDATERKIQSKTPPAKTATRSRKQKNFILENKLRVRRISSANKPRDDGGDSPRSSRKSVAPVASAAELSDLIRKMQKSTESALTPPLLDVGADRTDCPLHGDNAHESVKEQFVMVDIVEALRHYDVPNEMVKVLRKYHAFLAAETKDASDAKEEKNRKAIDNFMKKFEAMNIAAQDYLAQEPHLALFKTTAESIFVFSDTFNGDLDPMRINIINKTLAKLDTTLKRYNVKDVAIPAIERPKLSNPLAGGWMSNGFWNVSCVERVKNFSKAFSIKYSNKKQLLSLYEVMQRLQRTEYLNTLIAIILRDVIPSVKSNIDPTSAEYARAYKAMYIICQGLNPKVPVLVRTDS